MNQESVIILTGVSGSGKTTLQDFLIKEHSFTRPNNYTTRKPRSELAIRELEENFNDWESIDEELKLEDFSSTELDEYVFLNEEQFFKKLRNGDFAEHTKYNDNYYAVSKFFNFAQRNCVILEPLGVMSVIKFFTENWVPYKTVFLKIDEETQEERLNNQHRRTDINELKKRKLDFLYFDKMNYDLVLDGTKPIEENASLLIKEIYE